MPADKLKADVLTAFTGGELTPVLAGRIDREESRLGSRFLSNFMPQIQGGLKKFYGTIKVATVEEAVESGTCALVPFDSADEPLVLVFVGGKCYVATRTEFYPMGFQISSDKVVGASYQQINDVIKFTHETGGMYELHYLGRVNGKHFFDFVSSTFIDVPYFAIGWAGNYVGSITSTRGSNVDGDNAAHGSVTLKAGVPASMYELELPKALQNCTAGKNVIFEDDPYKGITGGYGSGAGALYDADIGLSTMTLMRIRNDEKTEVFSATIGNVTKQQFTREGTLNWQTGRYTDGIYNRVWLKEITAAQVESAFSSVLGSVTLSNSILQTMTFTKVPDGHEDGDQYYIKFEQGASQSQTTKTTSLNGYTGELEAPGYVQEAAPATLKAVTVKFGDTNVVGRRIKFLIQGNRNVRGWAQGAEYKQDEIVYSDGNYYRCSGNGITGWVAGDVQPIHTKGTNSDGSLYWQYLHSGFGVAIITSVKSDTEMQVAVDGYLPITTWGQNTYTWTNFQWSMWGYDGRYPSQVFTHKGRLGYTFDSGYYGAYLQLSKTDTYDDFGTEEAGQVLDTCAINTMITGHADNRINWVLPGYRLYMGSYSGEYNVAGSSSGALSPTTCAILPVSTIGGARVTALKFEEMNLFVGRLGSEVYSLNYDYTTDDYAPKNVGFPSSKLLEEGVVRLQALQNTDRNIYVRTAENKLRFINNAKEVGLLGFYRANMEGDVLDIACSNSGPTSTAFVLVKRGDITTVEYFESSQTPYMLSCRHYTAAEDEVLGATVYEPELVGKKVYVKDLETGQFRHHIVDEDGMVPMPKNAKMAVVGIAMPCVAYLNPAHGSKLEGLQQKAVRFIVRLFESGAFSYGSSNDLNRWYDYNRWSIVDSQKWDEHHGLITGDFELPSSFGYTPIPQASSKFPNTTAQALNIKSDTPEPFNILMVSNLYV